MQEKWVVCYCVYEMAHYGSETVFFPEIQRLYTSHHMDLGAGHFQSILYMLKGQSTSLEASGLINVDSTDTPKKGHVIYFRIREACCTHRSES